MILPQPSDQYWRHVNLELTTACNMTCPDCSAATNGSGKRKVVHHPPEYFESAARWLRGIEIVTVIGGEPTAHPKFAEIVPRLRDLFACKTLYLWTNGFLVRKYADLIRRVFDRVHASLYDERTAPWAKKPNTEDIEFIKANFPHSTMEEPHTPLTQIGSGKICGRGIHGPIAYADGKFYGCCVAMALPGGIGVEPGPNWREELLKTPLPCGECCFSPS